MGVSEIFPNTGSFLEVGCAGAYVLKALADANPEMHVTGADIFTEGLKEAKYRMGDRAAFIQTNATELSYSEEFDVIGAFDVIEHITDDVDALQEIHKALKPGGGVMITVPRHMFLWSAADTTAHHKRRYSGAQLRKTVTDAGFHILRQLSFGMITLPIQYISRRFLLTKSDKAS